MLVMQAYQPALAVVAIVARAIDAPVVIVIEVVMVMVMVKIAGADRSNCQEQQHYSHHPRTSGAPAELLVEQRISRR
jgi:hypothetical protein